MADVHDRMPVILHVKEYDAWLASEMPLRESVQALLRPFEAEVISKYPVNTWIDA